MQDYYIKKQMLDLYKNDLARLKRLRIALLDVIDRLGVQSVRFSDMPKGSSGVSDPAELQLKKCELEERIKAQESRVFDQRANLVRVFEKIENDKYSEVLEMYYFDNMTLFDISCHMNVGLATVKRYFRKGIDSIALKDI